MTLSEEFIAVDDGVEAAPTYPSAFGVTLTTEISGLLIALAGLAVGGYMLLNLFNLLVCL